MQAQHVVPKFLTVATRKANPLCSREMRTDRELRNNARKALCRLSGYGLGEVFSGLGETFDEGLLKHFIEADLERK